MSTDNKPLVSFSTGPFSVSLWENSFDAGDGTQRSMKSVSLRKGYFDKKLGKLENQSLSINPAELGCLIQLLAEMEKAVIERRGAEAF